MKFLKKYLLLIGILLTKSAKFLKIFKLLKAVKFVKVFITLGTMLVSVFVYSLGFGWILALGLVLLLLVHELGHVAALKLKGYPASAPIFIPMLGAAIFMPKIDNREDEAFAAYGGPLLGFLSAIVCMLVWYFTKSEAWLMFSYLAVFINLFNLIPLKPLDGGRVTYAVGTWFQWIGLAVLAFITLAVKEPSFLLIWIIVLMDFKTKFLTNIRRLYIAIGCYVSMIVMMSLGYGNQDLWINVVDCVIALLPLLAIYAAYRGWDKQDSKTEEKNDGTEGDENDLEGEQVIDEVKPEPALEQPVVVEEIIVPNLPFRHQMKWLVLYLALAIALIAMMMMQAPYLAKILPAQ